MVSKGYDLEQKNIYTNGSYVRIEEDQMTAWLFLMGTEESYTKEELYSFLQAHGVVKGYHESNIAAMAKKHVYECEIKVALGKTNENGKDGYFVYAFSPEAFKAPEILKDGSVDYSSMNALHTVKAGDLVAKYHPAIQGEDGYTVTGLELKACQAKNLSQIPGFGVAVDRETGEYRATMDGKIEIYNDRVDIRNVHEVRGDVDLLTKKIDFPGDVIIWGSVEAGVVINAERNIVIHGSVEAADLAAGGDIILSRGIQGAKKAKIVALGSVFADFIEHTTVEAGGDVQANSILNSNVTADGKVMVTGKGRKGVLMGGYTHGLQGVEATTMGNDSEVRTIVHAGYQTEDQKQYFMLKKEESDYQQNLADALEEMSALQRNLMIENATPSPLMERRIEELKKEKDKCYEQLAEIRKQMNTVNKVIQKGKGAKIIVDGNIFCGTIVCIDTLQMVIKHNTCYMRYFSMGGKMESNVIIK